MQGTNIEKRHEQESNLSATAAFVNGILKEHVTPRLQLRGHTAKANEIIRGISEGRFKADSSEVIDFFIALTGEEQGILHDLERGNADERASNVVSNYFSKLKNSIRNTAVINEASSDRPEVT